MSKDRSGRKYLKISEAKAGMIVELDSAFDCQSGKVELKGCFTGLYFDCKVGRHYIDGQYEHDYCIGMYKCD